MNYKHAIHAHVTRRDMRTAEEPRLQCLQHSELYDTTRHDTNSQAQYHTKRDRALRLATVSHHVGQLASSSHRVCLPHSQGQVSDRMPSTRAARPVSRSVVPPPRGAYTYVRTERCSTTQVAGPASIHGGTHTPGNQRYARLGYNQGA